MCSAGTWHCGHTHARASRTVLPESQEVGEPCLAVERLKPRREQRVDSAVEAFKISDAAACLRLDVVHACAAGPIAGACVACAVLSLLQSLAEQ